MSDEIGYNEAGESTDVDVLVAYCKQGVLDNNERNDAKTSDWTDGTHIVDTYLDHNEALQRDLELKREVVSRVSAWLEEAK